MMVFPCSQCDRSYKDQYDLKDHVEVIHGNKVYQCADCGRRDFNSRKSFRQHLRQHKIRPEAVPRPTGAPRAAEENIGKAAEFQCPLCDRGYQRKKRLKDHMDFVHSGKKVECSVCGRKDFNSMEYFREHMAKHRKRPNEVLRRGPGAALKRQTEGKDDDASEVVVMAPSAVHSGKSRPERTACSRCGEAFEAELACQRHLLKVHFSWARKHRCPSCFESFSEERMLEEHKGVKHPGGLQKCVSCAFACDSGERMRKHVMDVHDPESQIKFAL